MRTTRYKGNEGAASKPAWPTRMLWWARNLAVSNRNFYDGSISRARDYDDAGSKTEIDLLGYVECT